jgi:catechol 2,3-dioxygenase-like lactoylglutathione lyase family enzyme
VEPVPQLGLVIWTTDIAAVSRFLAEVAGLEVVEEFPGYAKLHAWNAVVELHGDDDAGRQHPWYGALAREGAARGIGAELRIRVRDVDAAFAAALRLGAQSIQAPAEVGRHYQATVMGPDGYFVTLWE